MIPRITPILLLNENRLVKTSKFRNSVYIGDPVNAIRVFSQKYVDEIIIVDITKRKNRGINFSLLEKMAEECFSPLTYAGGINSMDQVVRLFALGVEKVCINSAIRNNPNLSYDLIGRFGSQSIIASIDIVKIFGNYRIYSHDRLVKYNLFSKNVLDYINLIAQQGFGELFINFINRDGMYTGYDVEMIVELTDSVNCPVTVCGGCRDYNDIWNLAKSSNVSGIAAGSVFVYRNQNKGVLINYPGIDEIEKNLGVQL